MTRNEQIRGLTMKSAGPDLSSPSVASLEVHSRRAGFLTLANDLLYAWCCGLVAHQVLRPADPTSHGGLWSPSDKTMLGRAVDAVHPFLRHAEKTNDERFRDAALNVVNWTNRNLSLSDGSWKNGLQDEWQGITVFTATSIAEALRYHGHLLDPPVREAWLERLKRAGEWLYKMIGITYSNINYPIANAYAMAILGRLLDEGRYTAKGQELAHAALGCFTDRNPLLAGEGGRAGARSKKGCYPVDLGYNVEESLPSLGLYALLENDAAVLEQVAASLRVHTEFMLPDGGWDNSWGTRNYKWTWWGSRTTVGCQPAYALLADRDPLFLEVAFRNMELLRDCTKDGLLYGGLHNIAKDDTPSLHHTTCHAKGLATVLDFGIPPVTKVGTTLPCEEPYGIRHFSDIGTWLVSTGPWRATVTGYDWPFHRHSHPSGGALSLLWHQEAGLLAVAGMNIFKMIERFDMQDEIGPGFGTLTPRLEFTPETSVFREFWSQLRWHESATKTYMSILDHGARIDVYEIAGGVKVKAEASLLDHMHRPLPKGKVKVNILYTFAQERFSVEVVADGVPDGKQITCIFPVVSKPGEPIVKESDRSVRIDKTNTKVRVLSDRDFIRDPSAARIFSYVPGVAAIPVEISFEKNMQLHIEVSSV
jgi:hypothetical protein